MYVAHGQGEPAWRPGHILAEPGVSDSVTLINKWDGSQEGKTGLVYNNASCLQ